MSHALILSLLLWPLIDGSQQTFELPEFLQTPCTNLTKCLEELRPHLVKGVPQFRLSPIDPLHIPSFNMTRRGSKISDYTANLTNLIWTGCGLFAVLEKSFATGDVLRLRLRFPYLHLQTDAQATGTLLNFEMNGVAGDLSFNATGVELDIILDGKTYLHRGREFVRWEREDIIVDYEDFYFVHVHGIFEDPTLSHLFKLALNNGIRLVGSSARIVIGESVGSFIVDAVNRVHSLFPKDILYPIS